MTRIIVGFVLLVLSLAVNITYAQTLSRPSVEKRWEKFQKKLIEKTEWESSQMDSLEVLFKSFLVAVDKSIEKYGYPDRKFIERLEQERNMKIKDLLTQKQYDAFINIDKELKPKQR